jgi:MYXO-CTERM domain-containing protein
MCTLRFLFSGLLYAQPAFAWSSSEEDGEEYYCSQTRTEVETLPALDMEVIPYNLKYLLVRSPDPTCRYQAHLYVEGQEEPVVNQTLERGSVADAGWQLVPLDGNLPGQDYVLELLPWQSDDGWLPSVRVPFTTSTEPAAAPDVDDADFGPPFLLPSPVPGVAQLQVRSSWPEIASTALGYLEVGVTVTSRRRGDAYTLAVLNADAAGDLSMDYLWQSHRRNEVCFDLTLAPNVLEADGSEPVSRLSERQCVENGRRGCATTDAGSSTAALWLALAMLLVRRR